MYIRNEPILELSSGQMLETPIYIFGQETSDLPSIYIQAGIHGQEYLGYGVCLHLIEHFKKTPPPTKITIVPKANPYAMNIKMSETTFGRFDTITGSNWNRNYCNWLKEINLDEFITKHEGKKWTEIKKELRKQGEKILSEKLDRPLMLQDKLAYTWQRLSIQHDIIIDLHCDGISVPYIYCHDYAVDSAKNFGFDYYLTVHRYFKGSFDDASAYPFWTVFEACKASGNLDIEAFTLELGNKEFFDINYCKDFSDKILQYLKNKIPIKCDILETNKSTPTVVHQDYFKNIYSQAAGMVVPKAKLGEQLKPGETFCQIIKTDNKDLDLKDRVQNISFNHPIIPIAFSTGRLVHVGGILGSYILP